MAIELFQGSAGLPAKISWNSLLRPQVVGRAILGLKILCIAGLVILLILTVQLFLDSKIVSALNTGMIPGQAQTTGGESASKRNYDAIVKRNIFGTVEAPKAVTPPVTGPPPTQLPLSLIGTIVSGVETPYAIIENTKDKVQDVFVTGEMIFNEARVVKITPMKVEIERQGQIETLALAEEGALPDIGPGGVATVSENHFVVAEADLDKALENLPLLLSQARAVPYFKDGKSIGMRLFAIKPESMFEKLGLKNGDILKQVNDKSLADPTQALEIFKELKDERSLRVVLERSREEREFKYEIK